MYLYLGIHPHDAKHFDENSLKEIAELAEHKECVAIGECGLDFNRNFSPPEDQLKAFEAQVQMTYLSHSNCTYSPVATWY